MPFSIKFLRGRSEVEHEISRILDFIREYVRRAGSDGVVLGASGGIDSAVTSYLAVRALGAKRVTALLLFENESKKGTDYEDARRVISQLKMESIEFDITNVIRAFQGAIQVKGKRPSRISLANIKARVRMTFLYFLANERNLLVIGTGDRSEEEIGYFTKYGDGGVDFMPIAHLYKTEVRRLGKILRVPDTIIDKPSSPNLWKGQLAAKELPVDYPILDQILKLLFEENENESSASRSSGAPLKIVREVMSRHKLSEHKRSPPPTILNLHKAE